jgi:hypothetical protein
MDVSFFLRNFLNLLVFRLKIHNNLEEGKGEREMKRVIPAVLGLFFAANLCVAQNSAARLRRVTATLELQARGMSAAYNIPVGSLVTIRNPANGRPAPATIIEQIAEQQLIRLSPEVAKELGMVVGGPVEVQVVRLGKEWQDPLAAEQANTKAGPQIHTDVDVNRQTDTDKEPIHITINNYVITPQKSSQA